MLCADTISLHRYRSTGSLRAVTIRPIRRFAPRVVITRIHPSPMTARCHCSRPAPPLIAPKPSAWTAQCHASVGTWDSVIYRGGSPEERVRFFVIQVDTYWIF